MPFDDDDLELAFQLHVSTLLVEADLVTTDDEAAFLARHFPVDLLRERGFADAAGARTERFHDAAVEALATLPGKLDRLAKLDLLEACYKLALADGEFRIGEGAVLLMGARLLGLSDAEFDRFLERRGGPAGMTAAVIDRDVDAAGEVGVRKV
jgi:hypothetical protein